MPSLLHRQAEAGGHRRPRGALPASLRAAQEGGQVAASVAPGPDGYDGSRGAGGDRLSQLAQAKLAAVVRGVWGEADRTTGAFPAGATLRQGRVGWVHSTAPDRLVGGAMLWALGNGVDELHVIVEPDPPRPLADSESVARPGDIARRAAAFAPSPAVWVLSGRELTPARAERPPAEAPPPPGSDDLVRVITAAGADPVAEHGMLLAEVRGLEVARVETGPGGPSLRIGVGRHDREARALLDLHAGGGGTDPAAELARVVADIRARRVAGSASQPATLLSPERWLRSAVVGHPDLVGARRLEPVSPPVPRANLAVRSPAPAVGLDGDGTALVAVCSTGVDPELVPVAADARIAAAATVDGAEGPPRLVLVLPEGDVHPLVTRLAAALTVPAEVRSVPRHWRALAP